MYINYQLTLDDLLTKQTHSHLLIIVPNCKTLFSYYSEFLDEHDIDSLHVTHYPTDIAIYERPKFSLTIIWTGKNDFHAQLNSLGNNIYYYLHYG
jgi:hypothetical protein